MGLKDLYTLASRPAPNLQKSATPSRLQVKTAKDHADDKQLKVWRDQIIDRDDHTCRRCRCRVIRTLSLHPRRAECHHVAGRDEQTVRYESRAGLLLCASCHEQVTGTVNNKVLILGTVFFRKDGRKFINCDFPVIFKEAA